MTFIGKLFHRHHEPKQELLPPLEHNEARRVMTCSVCGSKGHTARKCPQKADIEIKPAPIVDEV